MIIDSYNIGKLENSVSIYHTHAHTPLPTHYNLFSSPPTPSMQAKYTDPLTGLRYASAQEFAFLRSLSPNLVQSYLSLRKAGHVVC